RYLRARLDYLDYAGARERGLPIGSGEIESGNRSVLQARLKISGAWWRAENAEKMMALRVTRANGEWQSYWRGLRQAHA
ncbi:MAG: ISKra4-like element ISTvi1 family transposase, partial [Pyrinomonadaceae bacterium]